MTRAYFFALGALVGAAAALTACADLERRLEQFFGAGDSRLYVLEDDAPNAGSPPSSGDDRG